MIEILEAQLQEYDTRPLSEFIETTIECPNCEQGYVEYEPRPYERNSESTGLCPTCRGKQEVEIAVCSLCAKPETECRCDDVAAKEIAA